MPMATSWLRCSVGFACSGEERCSGFRGRRGASLRSWRFSAGWSDGPRLPVRSGLTPPSSTPTATCDKPLHGCTAGLARHWRPTRPSLAWPRQSRATSAPHPRAPRGPPKPLAASKPELGLAEEVTVDTRHARALARRLLDPAVTPAQPDLGTAAVEVLSAELWPAWGGG